MQEQEQKEAVAEFDLVDQKREFQEEELQRGKKRMRKKQNKME